MSWGIFRGAICEIPWDFRISHVSPCQSASVRVRLLSESREANLRIPRDCCISCVSRCQCVSASVRFSSIQRRALQNSRAFRGAGILPARASKGGNQPHEKTGSLDCQSFGRLEACPTTCPPKRPGYWKSGLSVHVRLALPVSDSVLPRLRATTRVARSPVGSAAPRDFRNVLEHRAARHLCVVGAEPDPGARVECRTHLALQARADRRRGARRRGAL